MHVTEFQYDGPVSESYNQVWLRPRQDDRQSCLSFRLTTDPHLRASPYVDPLGNWVHRFNIIPEHRRLRVEAESVVLVQQPLPMPAETIRLDALGDHAEELEQYYDLLAPTGYVPHSPELKELVRSAEEQSDGTAGGFAHAASSLVHGRFRYEKGATHVHSSIEDAMATGAGVCQDFAHLLLALLRMRGLPGRYVSGHLAPMRTGEYASGMEEVIGGMASHAWAEVFIPGAGWFGLDPTPDSGCRWMCACGRRSTMRGSSTSRRPQRSRRACRRPRICRSSNSNSNSNSSRTGATARAGRRPPVQ